MQKPRDDVVVVVVVTTALAGRLLDFNPPLIVDCPMPQTLYVDSSTAGAEATWMPPTVVDDIDADVELSRSGPPPGSIFPIGYTEVEYRARDSAHNEAAACTFSILVKGDDSTTVRAQACQSCALKSLMPRRCCLSHNSFR